MMIDLHSHILPGLDDGAKTVEDSLYLTSSMKSWGFERIYCTPHINALYRNTPDTIKDAFDELNNALKETGVDIDIRMSAEYRLVPETWPEVLKKNWLMPMEDRYILMELPISKREEMKDIKPMDEFRKIISMGLTPILPHPERYLYLTHRELMEFVEAGVKIQCNYGSLAGLYGDTAEQNAKCLIDEGIVTFLGTDMHNAHYVDVIGEWMKSEKGI